MAPIIDWKRLTAQAAQAVLREVAADTGRIILTTHAKRRMRERDIIFAQIRDCLRNGVVIEGPALNIHGNWQVTLYRLSAGQRINVVAAIVREGHETAIVITAYTD